MVTVNTQSDLDFLLQNGIDALEERGVDITEDICIFLDGPSFKLDASAELFMSGFEFTLRGKGAEKTVIQFINCEKDTSNFEDLEVDIFEETRDVFIEDVFITADQTIELRFDDDETLSKWKNIGLNTAYVLIANLERIHDEFMEWFEGYDVEGALLPGDHVVVNRGYYTHHGIYIGNNKLIHYSGEPGTNGTICETTLKSFAKNNEFWVYKHSNSYTSSEIISRARTRLGEGEYNLIFNNCEHFCHWCCTGVAKSNQVTAVTILGIRGLWVAKLVNHRGAQKYGLKSD